MSELTEEEKRLLEGTRRRPAAKATEAARPVEQKPDPTADRGPHSPVQFDDDGWGGVPVQMRG